MSSPKLSGGESITSGQRILTKGGIAYRAVITLHRSGVCSSACPSVLSFSNQNWGAWRLFLTLIGRAGHTQRDSPRAAREAASVYLRLSIRRTDILVKD